LEYRSGETRFRPQRSVRGCWTRKDCGRKPQLLKALRTLGTVRRSAGSYDGRSAGAKAKQPRCGDREVNESLVLRHEIETKFERWAALRRASPEASCGRPRGLLWRAWAIFRKRRVTGSRERWSRSRPVASVPWFEVRFGCVVREISKIGTLVTVGQQIRVGEKHDNEKRSKQAAHA